MPAPISSPQIALLRTARRHLTPAVDAVQLAHTANPAFVLELEQAREHVRKALTWTEEAIATLVQEERDRRDMTDTTAEIDLLVSHA